MTDITDKMVDAAETACFRRGLPMRRVIEAALAAREPVNAGEVVERLRGKMMAEFGISELGDEAAVVIEELVEALKEYTCPGVDNSVKDLRCSSLPSGSCLRRDCGDYCGQSANSVLTRMGVKL